MNYASYEYKGTVISIYEEDGSIIKIDHDPIHSTHYETAIIKACYQQICEYLDGKRQIFTVPYKLKGSDFQIEVWEAIIDIPYGETRSYRRIAEVVGRPRAARAVGTACNRCQLAYLVPCQRVLASSGIGGYGNALDEKIKLLNLEATNS